MKNITITKENLLKAHSEGCPDTKKVLENLCPDEFEKKYDSNKIYAYHYSGRIRILTEIKDKYFWVNCTDTRIQDEWPSIEVAINYAKRNFNTESFDNQKDFFTWALKQLS